MKSIKKELYELNFKRENGIQLKKTHYMKSI